MIARHNATEYESRFRHVDIHSQEPCSRCRLDNVTGNIYTTTAIAIGGIYHYYQARCYNAQIDGFTARDACVPEA